MSDAHECRACGEPIRMTCSCSGPDVEQFCDLDTREMARFFAAVVQEGDRRDREERAKPRHERSGSYIGYDWFMWPSIGKEVANLDGEVGERARAFVLQVYDGMMRTLSRRLGDWRRSYPIGECARERGVIR